MHLPGWDTILGIIFIAGALYVLMRWIFSLINVIRLIRSGEKKTREIPEIFVTKKGRLRRDGPFLTQ
jgi:hypothetical protein